MGDSGDAESVEIGQLLATLADTSRTSDERSEALSLLRAKAFNIAAFDPHKAAFTQTLRTVATDADATLRRTALATLAQEKDPYAQNLLIQGLQNPGTALVSPLFALQLLGTDDHAATASLARDILANGNDPAVRAEAAYLLASDPTAASLLTALLMDKAEHKAVRQASAVSLRVIDPDAFHNLARGIAADKSDLPERRALSRTSLALLSRRSGGGSSA